MIHDPSLTDALADIGAPCTGRHRAARVLRGIHRHSQAHRRIIGQLRRRQQRQARRAAARFAAAALQRARERVAKKFTQRGRRA